MSNNNTIVGHKIRGIRESKNLTVEVASGKKVKGGDYTGILIGRNAKGSIVNCKVKGDDRIVPIGCLYCMLINTVLEQGLTEEVITFSLTDGFVESGVIDRIHCQGQGNYTITSVNR